MSGATFPPTVYCYDKGATLIRSVEVGANCLESPTIGLGFNPRAYRFTPSIFTFDTTKTGTGSTTNKQVKLPLAVPGVYDFVVAWGDGSTSRITSYNQAESTHTYAASGVYTVTITGMCQGWAFADAGDKLKLISINQWGTSVRFNSTNAFRGCTNLASIAATDEPAVVQGSNIGGMFHTCTALTGIPAYLWPNFSKSAISMSNLLQNDANLVSTVGIGSWDVSTVQLMNAMFYGCTKFATTLNGWDVSQVTQMGFMMRGTGGGAGGAHPTLNLTAWTPVSTVRLDGFLEAATWGAVNFSGWDVSKVTTLEKMMYLCSYSPTLDTTGWDTSAVINMSQVFKQASLLNSPVDHWNVSNVTTMYEMFRAATVFDQSLASWNVEKVTTMEGMFRDATAFKQNIGAWWPKACTNFADFLRGCDINSPNSATSRANYDALLVGWTGWSGGAPGAKGLALQNNVAFHAGAASTYSAGSDAAAARTWLTTPVGSGGKGWTITDGGAALSIIGALLFFSPDTSGLIAALAF